MQSSFWFPLLRFPTDSPTMLSSSDQNLQQPRARETFFWRSNYTNFKQLNICPTMTNSSAVNTQVDIKYLTLFVSICVDNVLASKLWREEKIFWTDWQIHGKLLRCEPARTRSFSGGLCKLIFGTLLLIILFFFYVRHRKPFSQPFMETA